ncbi:MAG: nucleotide exchange factor GrpE [Bacteroidales bacterium]|nr:nucleotide exchange factor GrpE [Bacteroidales bacterium]
MSEKNKQDIKEQPAEKPSKKVAKDAAKIAELEKQLEEANAALAKEKDDYLLLMADFTNFRRKTAQEKIDLINSASKDTIEGMLPVLDDIEIAIKTVRENVEDKSSLEGLELIYNKLMNYLKSKGLEVIKAKDEPFNTDFHEAVAQFPVPEEDRKGLVFDVVQTGYTLNGKVIRFSKVVVAI